MALWAAWLDGGAVDARSASSRRTARAAPSCAGVAGLPDDGGRAPTLLLLADPFTFPVDRVPRRSSPSALPDLAVVGGLASAGAGPAATGWSLDGALHDRRRGRRAARPPVAP